MLGVCVKGTKKENVTNLKAKEKANNLFICINLHMCAFDPNHFILLFYFFFIPYLALVFALPLSIQVVYFRFVLLLHATTTGLYSVQLFMCRHRSQRYRCRMVFPFNFCVLPRTHANNWSEWPYKYVTSLTIIVRAFLVLKMLRRFYINCVSVCVFFSCYRGFAGGWLV